MKNLCCKSWTWAIEPSGKFLHSEGAHHISGHADAELLNKNGFEILSVIEGSHDIIHLKKFLEGKNVERFISKVRHINGHTIHCTGIRQFHYSRGRIALITGITKSDSSAFKQIRPKKNSAPCIT